MPIRLRHVLPLAALVAAATLAGPGVANADSGNRSGPLLRSGLVGSTLAPAGPTLFGVTPGTSPWVADDTSRVRVDRDGRVEIRIRGLVIPTAPANGTNPVPRVSASVVCNGSVAATTDAVPFSPRGNARISEVLTLPGPCLAPAVLVHPNTATSVYIAATG